MSTDLGELIRAQCAERIKEGKRPTRAQMEWLEAIREPAQPHSSVELSRNAKGEMQFTTKAMHADPYEAERIAVEIGNRLRATYPMADGTVGSPMREPKANP
jgi:hypothetical protein